MSTPTPGYSITVRVSAPPAASTTADRAVSGPGGALTALDVVESHSDSMVVDVTCNASDAEHAASITEAFGVIEGVSVGHVSDRTFLLHLGGSR